MRSQVRLSFHWCPVNVTTSVSDAAQDGLDISNVCVWGALIFLIWSLCDRLPFINMWRQIRAQTIQTSPGSNSNCLQLLAGRVSWAPPAAGAAFPPALPAGTSRQPACLSWRTGSYPIPENLSINSGVTRPAQWGTHIWTTKQFNWSLHCGPGIYPRNQGNVK